MGWNSYRRNLGFRGITLWINEVDFVAFQGSIKILYLGEKMPRTIFLLSLLLPSFCFAENPILPSDQFCFSKSSTIGSIKKEEFCRTFPKLFDQKCKPKDSRGTLFRCKDSEEYYLQCFDTKRDCETALTLLKPRS